MSEISLELKNIKKSFQEGEDVLESICLTAKKGEFVTLLGSSGCGKTTIINVLKKCYEKLNIDLKTYLINPKSMPKTQLLGLMNNDTR